jgi:hypothetical protein
VQTEPVVRLLRGLALLAVVLAAYLFQYVFQHDSVIGLFPTWLIEWFPWLSRYMRWRSAGLTVAATWLFLLAAIAFGMLSPMWRGEIRTRYRPQFAGGQTLAQGRQSLFLLAGAGLLAVLAAIVARFVSALSAIAPVLWAGSILVFFLACYEVVRRAPKGTTELRHHIDFGPLRGWPILAGILGFATLAYVFRWLAVPARIDLLTAEAGLMAIGHTGTPIRVEMNGLHVSGVALTVSTLCARLWGDGLAGVRMAGLSSGLLLIVAVWLLGGELFHRTPSYGRYGEMNEDDGLFAKALATVVAAFGLPALFFSRAPIVLEGVAWGSLGLWALLYGVRTGLLPVVGVSGVLLGVSALFGSSGLALIGVGLSIWAGVGVLRPGWIKLPLGRGFGAAMHGDFVYWICGLAVVLLPLFAGVIGSGTELALYLSSSVRMDNASTVQYANLGTVAPQMMGLAAPGLRSAVLAPTIPSGAVGLLGFDAPMLSSLIAPLYILGLGAVVLNMDTLTGWVIGGWLILGASLSILLARPMVPHWASLAVIWPAVALTTAFALDRLRAAVTMFAGEWTTQASLYLAAGLAIGAAIFSWLSFYELAMQNIDAASAVGREARQAVRSGDVAIILDSGSLDSQDETVISFLAGTAVGEAGLGRARVHELPASLSSRTRLIMSVEEADALQEVRSLYPEGELRIYRDLRGNPAAYTYVVDP